jgi:hypothetical protein
MTMRTGPTLTEDRLDRFEPLGAFGQPVYRNHVQLQAALRQRLGPKYADFFALPQFDSQGKTVRWISPVEGEARRWSELSEEDQVARSLDLQVMKSEFDTYLGELRAYQNEGKEPRGAKAFVAVLEQALKTPNDGHLFFVGDQPVATFWGFKEVDRPPFETLTAAPRTAPAQAGPAAAAPPPPAAEPARRFPWWWLLLPLLLLLLALLLWWFWPDDRPAEEVPTDRPAIEAPLEEPLPEAPIDRTAVGTVVDGDGVIVDGDGVRVPGGELEGTVDEEGTVLPEGEAGTDGTLPADQDAAGEEPKGEEAGTEGETPPDEAAEPPMPEPAAEETPPEGEQPDAEAGNTGDEPSAPESPAPGEPPAIPDDAEDGAAGFMTGSWRSDSGLVDRQTKQKLIQEYRFDEDGKGETVIRRADGVTCRAPATATVQGGSLQVQELENLKCDDGSAFRKSRTVCTRDASGKAECIGTDEDGNRYKVDLNRGGQP